VEYGDEKYEADDFGIESEKEWKLEMEKEEDWISENQTKVQRALIEIESEWPRTVSVIRKVHL
jgi:hypothetical protein